MHFLFPEQSLHICLSSAIALSWLKLKAQVEAALSKHFSGIFFISSYHYTHNPFFALTPSWFLSYRMEVRGFIWIGVYAKMSLKVSLTEDAFFLEAVMGRHMQND